MWLWFGEAVPCQFDHADGLSCSGPEDVMKRVLLVTTSYPQQGEGAAAAGMFVRDFARALAAFGVAVEVVAPARRASVNKESGVIETRFAVPRLPLSLLNPTHIQDWPAIFSTLARGQKAMSEACACRRPDHILALWALPSGAWAMRAGKRFGIAYSTWALGSDIWALGKIPIIRQYLGRVMRHAQHRFADGFQLAADVEAICARSCAFLASSRDFGSPSPRAVSAAPPYRLAFLGRWHPNKGVDLLLAALEQLSDQDWANIAAVRLHGGGPLETQVRERVRALQLSGKPLEVGGYLDLQGARDLFGWSDYVLIPSRIESIPVVFSDAMQARRPVIATPVGDLPRLVPSCGLLATTADANAIAQVIRQAICLDATRFTEGIARSVEHFDVKASAGKFFMEITQNV
jgi:glycosyltransferase involved in cell wall biosynthesis